MTDATEVLAASRVGEALGSGVTLKQVRMHLHLDTIGEGFIRGATLARRVGLDPLLDSHSITSYHLKVTQAKAMTNTSMKVGPTCYDIITMSFFVLAAAPGSGPFSPRNRYASR